MSTLSTYALRMGRLSARIFGEVVRPTDDRSMKVVKLFSEQPLAKRKEVYNWYPPHNTYVSLMRNLRYLGLYSPWRIACTYSACSRTVKSPLRSNASSIQGKVAEMPAVWWFHSTDLFRRFP
uniref:Small ribosomal subunit protein mS33 n=1 Tax=Leptobrachium leishanense TaxID=445787 RepID=A0A8C5QEB3_9ANUR